MEDHLHILVDIPPKYAVADIIREMKSGSSHFLGENTNFPHFKGWSIGYTALSYGKNELDNICKYIINQKEHHRTLTTRDEILKLLKEMGYPVDDPYFEKNI